MIYVHISIIGHIRSSSQTKKNAQDLLQLKVNKKLLQQHLCEATGKVVTLKDITNMQTSSQNTKNSSIEELVTQLKAIDGEVYVYIITLMLLVLVPRLYCIVC